MLVKNTEARSTSIDRETAKITTLLRMSHFDFDMAAGQPFYDNYLVSGDSNFRKTTIDDESALFAIESLSSHSPTTAPSSAQRQEFFDFEELVFSDVDRPTTGGKTYWPGKDDGIANSVDSDDNEDSGSEFIITSEDEDEFILGEHESIDGELEEDDITSIVGSNVGDITELPPPCPPPPCPVLQGTEGTVRPSIEPEPNISLMKHIPRGGKHPSDRHGQYDTILMERHMRSKSASDSGYSSGFELPV